MMINVIWRSLALDLARKPISRLNLIYPYYMNSEMFVEQQRRWLTFPADILDKVHFIIVDDGSPKNQAVDFVLDAPDLLHLDIYRIDIDKPWNNEGAQNLGALFCVNEWIFLSDMDYFLPLESIRKIFSLKPRRFEYFMFKRLKAHSGWNHISELALDTLPKNSFLIHWYLYWKVGGRNEDFSGFYSFGWAFRNKLRRFGRQKLLDAYVVWYERDVISDAGTSTVARTTKAERQRMRGVVKDREFRKSLPENPLRFPWHKEYSSIRKVGRQATSSGHIRQKTKVRLSV
jgi:hypothetical protein